MVSSLEPKLRWKFEAFLRTIIGREIKIDGESKTERVRLKGVYGDYVTVLDHVRDTLVVPFGRIVHVDMRKVFDKEEEEIDIEERLKPSYEKIEEIESWIKVWKEQDFGEYVIIEHGSNPESCSNNRTCVAMRISFGKGTKPKNVLFTIYIVYFGDCESPCTSYSDNITVEYETRIRDRGVVEDIIKSMKEMCPFLDDGEVRL